MKFNWSIVAGFSIIIISSLALVINIYRLVYIDAISRGLKKPRFWAILSVSGQSGEGLIFYLFKRRKYESNISKDNIDKMEKIKNRIKYIICFDFIGFIILVINIILVN